MTEKEHKGGESDKPQNASNSSQQKPRFINKKYLFGFFFFIVFIFLLYEFVRLLIPFVDSIVLSIALVLIFFPLHKFIRNKLVKSPNIAAGLSVALVLIIVGLPFTFTGGLLLKESKDVINKAEKIVAQIPDVSDPSFHIDFKPPFDKAAKRISAVAKNLDIDIRETVYSAIKNLGSSIAKSTAKLAKNALGLIFDGIVLILTLFLFFRDGENIAHSLIKLAPMDSKYKHIISTRLYETVVAVIRGVVLTAGIQGFLAAVGYSIAGVGLPAMLGILTAIAAVFPIGGATIVWFPVTLYIFFAVSKGWALFLFLWCLILVSSLDNFIRPILIGSKAKLPIIILIISILGGFRVYGVRGLLVGPLLVACVIAFIQIYRQEFYFSKEKQQD